MLQQQHADELAALQSKWNIEREQLLVQLDDEGLAQQEREALFQQAMQDTLTRQEQVQYSYRLRI